MMHYHSNHMSLNVNGVNFYSRHAVSFESGSSSDSEELNHYVDWDNLIEERTEINQEKLERYKKKGIAVEEWMFEEDVPYLKKEVVAWLNENIQPPKKESDQKDIPNGWVSDHFGKNSGYITILFYRRKDAMKFIKEWSVYKSPTSYLNYFSGYSYKKDNQGKIIKRNPAHK